MILINYQKFIIIKFSKLIKNLNKKFSLKKNCQFVQTSYDAISSMLGCGATSSGDLGDMSGTVSNIRILNFKKSHILEIKFYTHFFTHLKSFI